jgi:hypothetical protein
VVATVPFALAGVLVDPLAEVLVAAPVDVLVAAPADELVAALVDVMVEDSPQAVSPTQASSRMMRAVVAGFAARARLRPFGFK